MDILLDSFLAGFSSAFNTFQPHLISELGKQFGLDRNVVCWTLDFLTCRTQRVRVNRHFSDLTTVSNHQRALFFLLACTAYRQAIALANLRDHQILKFADDTIVVSLLNSDETPHGPVVD